MRLTRLPAFLLIASIMASIGVSRAAAQDSPPSISELRRENEQLRLRIDELESQLERSQEAIENLLEQVRQLNDRLSELQRQLEQSPAEVGPSSAAESETARVPAYADLPEGETFAAPEALLRFARRAYEENFGEVTLPFESNDARARYLRDVESWAKSLRRSQRSQIEWIIEVREVLTDAQPLTIEYQAVDPQTRTPYGDRVFTLQIPTRFERRFRENDQTRYWQLGGVAGLAPNINPDRESIGFFDVRPFIGPFVEFGMDLSVNSFLPAPELETEEQPSEGAGGEEGDESPGT